MNPVRTCVGCRGRENKAELLRLVTAEARIIVDVRQNAPGRGAYLHPAEECWRKAIRQRSLTRALRAPAVDPEPLLAELAAAVADGNPA